MKKETTASVEKWRKEKCRSCGLTDQEMDAALLLIQLSGDSTLSVSSSSSSRSESSNRRLIDQINNNNNNHHFNFNFKSTRVRKFRTLLDLYQSTSPLTNYNLHGNRITAESSNLLLLYKDDDDDQTEEERSSSDLISDAGSVIIERRHDDHNDMEMTIEHELIHITTTSSCDGGTPEKKMREGHKLPLLPMVVLRKNTQNNPPLLTKRKFLDFSPT